MGSWKLANWRLNEGEHGQERVQDHQDVTVYSTVGGRASLLLRDLQQFFRLQGGSVNMYIIQLPAKLFTPSDQPVAPYGYLLKPQRV